jgi:hypothetical protein
VNFSSWQSKRRKIQGWEEIYREKHFWINIRQVIDSFLT